MKNVTCEEGLRKSGMTGDSIKLNEVPVKETIPNKIHDQES